MPRIPKNDGPKMRLNLDIPPQARKRLEQLRSRMECDTFVEVVRRSLALMELAVTAKEQGGKVLMEIPGKEPIEVASV